MRTGKIQTASVVTFALAFAGGAACLVGRQALGAQAGARELERAVVRAVGEVRPAVVHISVEKILEVPFISDPFAELFGRRRTRPYRSQGMGSGVIVSPDGYILTNHHVVGEADTIKVKLQDGRVLPARRVGTDQLTDVAVVKIHGRGHPYAELADSDELKVGQFAIAIGAPFGLDQTVTMGVISARGRRGIVGISRSYEDFIQTDVAINPGNSGGPLVNLEGKVIGINSAIFSRSGGYQGIGFAIPANLAKTIMDRLVKVGYVERAWLGVEFQDVTPDLAQSLGLQEPEGAAISRVDEGSPADRAGLRPYDAIVNVAGKKVRNVHELRNRVAHTPVGERVAIEYIREGRRYTTRPRLAAHPVHRPVLPPAAAEEAPAASSGKLGLKARRITRREARQLGYPDAKGLVVVRVYPGGAADEARIEAGYVILDANRVPVASEEKFAEIIRNRKPGGPFLLRVRTPMGTRLVTLRF